MNLLQKKKKGIQLNITSLIDVMFILIIFYSVTSTFLEQPGFELNLPEASNAQTVQVKDNVLFVSPDSALFINDQKVNVDSLLQKLKKLHQTNKSGSLILQADEKVPNGFVVELMDMANQAGFDQLTISTEPKK